VVPFTKVIASKKKSRLEIDVRDVKVVIAAKVQLGVLQKGIVFLSPADGEIVVEYAVTFAVVSDLFLLIEFSLGLGKGSTCAYYKDQQINKPPHKSRK
jgi:hypothetical protein